jgi:cytochrome c oxidase subunit 2
MQPRVLILCCVPLLSGCQDWQSVLAPRGPESERIYILWSVLFWGGSAIFFGIMGLVLLACFGKARWKDRISNETTITLGGIVFPTLTLALLLGYGLWVMRPAGVFAEGEPLQVEIIGERWWWRVVYHHSSGVKFESANELRIPAGRRVEVTLTTTDVIHSFWVPQLAGKVDMIPGRTNFVTLIANNPGVSRGQCAEYCGGPHAMMGFHVVALEPETFETWMAQEMKPAEPTQEAGQQLFLTHGCAGCHTIRGTAAAGKIGPDLTKVGSRLALGAAVLDNSPRSMAAWIADAQHLKPANRMPSFRIFTGSELAALSQYLAGLK